MNGLLAQHPGQARQVLRKLLGGGKLQAENWRTITVVPGNRKRKLSSSPAQYPGTPSLGVPPYCQLEP
ncbi:MAG: hypothetical protein VST67_12370, partial [Nitrospirota bacterium]|nr:hypothetical protein [Nitrospirota bacterium]